MERMMKLQDVLLKAMAKKISWADAAEIIGVSCRTMRRWRERMEEGGYSGLRDRRKGKASGKRVPLKDSGTGAGAVPGNLPRPEHPALPRKAPRASRDQVELHLGATGTEGRGPGGARQEARQASAAPRTEADAGHAAAHRREQAPVVGRATLARPDRDPG